MAYRFAFVMEQTLGQVTHTQNFQQWVAKDPDVIPTWIPISFENTSDWERTPIVSGNWTLRASLAARSRVREALRTQHFDALFFHTQVTALFGHRLMASLPSVVSMDATPLNFDKIGTPYDHVPGNTRLEAVKNALTRRTFSRAKCLVVWHHWGKESLVEEYGAPPDKVSVIPPGIDLERWNFPRRETQSGKVRLLFVGGDFRRKGGETLLTAFRESLKETCELDIITREEVDVRDLPNVRVHRGLGSNAPQLMALFAQADVFVFPTLADVLPLAIMEAMASSLPIVTTTVGAISEEIEEGVNGLVIPPNDAGALAAATLKLVKDPNLRLSMGVAARRVAEQRFSGETNYRRLLDVCKNCIEKR